MKAEEIDEARQRRGERVMRRHHEEAHMVGDLLRREERAVLTGSAAELREDVVAAALAPERHLALEVIDDEGAAFDAAPHRGAGQRFPDDADRGRVYVDEGALERLDIARDFAQKRGCGEIERQLLDRGIEEEIRGSLAPFSQPPCDAGVELGEIGLERSRLEGDRERAAMEAMLVEIEQHQAA